MWSRERIMCITAVKVGLKQSNEGIGNKIFFDWGKPVVCQKSKNNSTS